MFLMFLSLFELLYRNVGSIYIVLTILEHISSNDTVPFCQTSVIVL